MKAFLQITLLLLLFVLTGCEQRHLPHDKIVLGQSCALSGPAKFLGSEFERGARLAFDEASKKGMLNTPLELITLDDRYEPQYAKENAKTLIEKEQVYGLFGGVGTPTAKAILPLAHEANTPFLTPFTGAHFLYETDASMIALRASYAQETEALIDYLTEVKGLQRIGIVFQNDSYGRTGLEGVRTALARRDLDLVAMGMYKRNTLAVTSALREMVVANPEAIVMIGAYKPSAEFIRRARLEGLHDTLFANISFVGTGALLRALKYQTQNLLISQVVPSPWGESAIATHYRNALLKAGDRAPLSFVSLEGYIAARLTLMALKVCEQQNFSSPLVECFEALGQSRIEDFTISLGKGDHHASSHVYLTLFERQEARVIKTYGD